MPGVRDAGSRPLLRLISLNGILDQDAEHLFSEATLHRAISDLTLLFQQRQRERILLAGDLNIFWQWDKSSIDGDWAPRFNTVFDRLGAYGMDLIGPHGERPMDGCPCLSRGRLPPRQDPSDQQPTSEPATPTRLHVRHEVARSDRMPSHRR